MPGRRTLLALLAIYVLSLLPLAGTFLIHYPDERYYTDGALQMLRSGDYLTPRWDDGTERFRKPVVPYWLVAGSYALLGPRVLASRSPFLMCGAAVIACTFIMARRWLDGDGPAVAAAAILASHVQIIFASVRAIPDAPLVLFMLVSAWGFMELLAPGRRRDWRWALAAWGGLGLAVATKGLLGVVFGLYVVAFAGLVARRWRTAGNIVHAPSIVVGIVLGAGWFASMYALHGPSYLDSFWADQVGRKATGLSWAPLVRIPLYPLIYGLNFLPWTVIALELCARQRWHVLPAAGQRRALWLFVLGWAGLLCMIFGWGVNPSLRYVLPAAPLVALLIADILHRAPIDLLRKPLIRWLGIMIAALTLLGALLATANVQTGTIGSTAAVLALSLGGAAALIIAARRRWWPHTVGLAAAIVLMFPVVFAGVARIFLPDSSGVIHCALTQAGGGDGPVLFVGALGLGSKLEVRMGLHVGLDRVRTWDEVNPAALDEYQAIIVTQEQADQPALATMQRHLVPLPVGRIDAGEFLAAIVRGELAQHLEDRRPHYVIAVRERN